MSYRTEQFDGYAVVHLDGEVDLSTSPAARKLIIAALHRPQDLLVDLSAVTYIDSSGIANLVEGYQMAKQHDVHFGLVGVSDAALSVLRLARLDQVFAIYSSLDDWPRKAKPTRA
jgi:anti-sigma B factor antagonist